MPTMELDNLEKPKKKPFKFLTGVFKRGRSDELKITEDMLYGTEDYQKQKEERAHSPEMSRSYSKTQTTPGRTVDIEAEMEDLHLSRRDNPYLSSCEALDDYGDDTSLSPTPGSPRQNESISPPETFSPESITELHAHLIRSPPPVHWPAKTIEFDTTEWNAPISPSNRSSDRAFSPESGSDGMETERSYQSYSQRSQSVERMISPGPDMLSPSVMSPVRGQTPALSPARGQTPDMTDFSPPPHDRTRLNSTPSDNRLFSAQHDSRMISPRSTSQSYNRSISSSSNRLRSKTPDEEFSPTRFNIYTLHQRGMNRSQKSESSYLVTSPGRDLVHHYQPASRRSLAQLANNSRSGSGARKSSTEHFLSWIPRRSRSRSRSRADAKSMENLQSPTHNHGIRNLKDSSSYSHKSLSCMGEGAGLINHEGGTLSVSPRPPRRRFSGIKKSLSLKQKKSGTGPFYVDIDTQDNL